MKLTTEMLRLYAVTDRSWLRGQTLLEQVEQALAGGVTLVQLREKELDERRFFARRWIWQSSAIVMACRC